MEGSQYVVQLSSIGQESTTASTILSHVDIVAYPSTYHINEGAEDKQNPQDTKDIEEHMGQSGTASLSISREGCQIRRNRCSDVLTQH